MRKCLADALLPMAEVYLDAVLAVQVFCQMLCRIDTTVLPSGAPEGEHERREPTLQITLYMVVGQSVDAFQEGGYLTVILKEAYDGFVEPRQLLVLFIAAGVMGGTAVEDIATTIAALVSGDAFLIRETVDADDKEPDIAVGRTGRCVAIALRRRDYLAQRLLQFRILTGNALTNQAAQIVDCRRDGGKEMLLPLEITAIAIGTEDLQRTEEHEKHQAGVEGLAFRRCEVVAEFFVVDVDKMFPQIFGITG